MPKAIFKLFLDYAAGKLSLDEAESKRRLKRCGEKIFADEARLRLSWGSSSLAATEAGDWRWRGGVTCASTDRQLNSVVRILP